MMNAEVKSISPVRNGASQGSGSRASLICHGGQRRRDLVTNRAVNQEAFSRGMI